METPHGRGGKPMRDLESIADRIEIEALRGEFTGKEARCLYE
jgi:hypothetical protein